MNEPVLIATAKPDAVLAAELKAEVTAKLNELCDILNRANAAGLFVNFGIGFNAFGRQAVQSVVIGKHF